MKKQLLIAAVAATMSATAMADLSITGNADFEYNNTDYATATTKSNTSDGEVNIIIDGSHGDTKVHLEQEFQMQGGSSTSTQVLDVEDVWVSTKIGDFGVKAGAWDTSATSGVTSNILQNTRSNNKVYVTTSVGDVNLGVWSTASDSLTGDSAGSATNDGLTANVTVGGVKIDVKESFNAFTAVRLSGSVAGVDLVHENLDSDTANRDANFSSATYSTNGVTLNAMQVRGDHAAAITEDDGSFEAYDDATTGASVITKNQQLTASMDIAGNTVTVGAVRGTEDDGTENNASKIIVTRALAGGTTLKATYADVELANSTDSVDVFTAKLSVSF